jgi:hypothetical protein
MLTPLRELIIRTDWLLTAHAHFSNPLKRVVVLGCGHRIVSTRSKRARCLRCEEMLRRSLADGSEDYAAYRAGDAPDRMEWPDDPFRGLNERVRV